MDFSGAIKELHAGNKVKRKGWNGKNQYVQIGYMVKCTLADGTDLDYPNHEQTGCKFLMFVGSSGFQCGWLASQADMLAMDWEVVEDN